MEVESTEARFAFCINNGGYPDDLKVRTIYQVLPDESGARSNFIRVLDETGDDYLYPARPFCSLLTCHPKLKCWASFNRPLCGLSQRAV